MCTAVMLLLFMTLIALLFMLMLILTVLKYGLIWKQLMLLYVGSVVRQVLLGCSEHMLRLRSVRLQTQTHVLTAVKRHCWHVQDCVQRMR